MGFLTSTRLFAANDTTFVLWHDIQSTGRDFSSIATSIASFSANDGMYVL
ncbi:MAG: hypothetical protein JNL32_01880 [Candidatus Kapabacteria bacterium]|nr:hypothetical protein [Candidatus Kapabacteria bacterium]